MKTTITILLTLFWGVIYSQEKKLVWNKITCEGGIQRASKDFSQCYYYCESIGLTSDNDPKFTELYDNYSKTKHGIIYGNGGCIVTEYRKCYEEKMEKLIVEKFGADIFERLLNEARELYKEKKYCP